MKFSKSIKNIIIKIKLKIDKKIIENKLSKLKKIDKKIIPVNNSTMIYLNEITFLHFLHLPLKNKKDIIGKLSYQLIFFLHFGQNDRLIIICLFFGKR